MKPITPIFTLEEYSNLIDEGCRISVVINRVLITTRLRAEVEDSIIREVCKAKRCFGKISNLLITMMEFDFPDSATVHIPKAEIRLQWSKDIQPQCCEMGVLAAVRAMAPNAINRVPHTHNELLVIAKLFLQLHSWLTLQRNLIKNC